MYWTKMATLYGHLVKKNSMRLTVCLVDFIFLPLSAVHVCSLYLEAVTRVLVLVYFALACLC